MEHITPFTEYAASRFHIGIYMVKLITIITVALVLHEIAVRIVVPIIKYAGNRSKIKPPHHDIIYRWKVITRVCHLIPAAVVAVALPFIADDGSAKASALVNKAVSLYCVIIGLVILNALLNAAHDIYDSLEKNRNVSITGIIQAFKVASAFLAIVAAVALLAGHSPAYYLSGLGAFTAILLLIFKDAILGLVAGVQLSAMDLVRKGDWIEIPKHGADGNVEDVSLTTVKVRNWDKTLVAVPAYELVSSSFKNWRAMLESGGRRIKRSMRFDVNSLGFLTKEDVDRLSGIKLLKPYLDRKQEEIESSNREGFSEADLSAAQANGRRLTNIGTFRAYCEAYLCRHPGINREMTVMVRQLEPTELGLPLEIYAFSNDVRWPFYENIQSDIFDHLFAILPEFGLKAYQR